MLAHLGNIVGAKFVGVTLSAGLGPSRRNRATSPTSSCARARCRRRAQPGLRAPVSSARCLRGRRPADMY